MSIRLCAFHSLVQEGAIYWLADDCGMEGVPLNGKRFVAPRFSRTRSGERGSEGRGKDDHRYRSNRFK